MDENDLKWRDPNHRRMANVAARISGAFEDVPMVAVNPPAWKDSDLGGGEVSALLNETMGALAGLGEMLLSAQKSQDALAHRLRGVLAPSSDVNGAEQGATSSAPPTSTPLGAALQTILRGVQDATRRVNGLSCYATELHQRVNL